MDKSLSNEGGVKEIAEREKEIIIDNEFSFADEKQKEEK